MTHTFHGGSESEADSGASLGLFCADSAAACVKAPSSARDTCTIKRHSAYNYSSRHSISWIEHHVKPVRALETWLCLTTAHVTIPRQHGTALAKVQ